MAVEPMTSSVTLVPHDLQRHRRLASHSNKARHGITSPVVDVAARNERMRLK